MKEFYDFLINFYTIPLYLITWIVVIFRYRIYVDTPLKFFPIFVIFTFLSEMLGYLIWRFDEFQFLTDDAYSNHNVIVYNIYALVSFQFFYHVYWQILQLEKHKKWVVYGVFTSILAFSISLFFQNPFHISLYYADIISSLILLICIGLYIHEKRTDKEKYPTKHNLMFWTSLGLTIFYICFPIVFYVGHELPTVASQNGVFDVLMIAVLFMYVCFIAGAIFGRRKTFR
ncbi:hypothetical protein [Allomuricauda sp. NBRC 101325]|uniref:hypothetical protein n=1 Tax=Allomuricauda sp. NBRC 101325 TaxID=1113758 RepID=UPI0024A5924B|nr:hypothetical protein [Muricauda sp. NBRC 101325]GLU44004.1 hypothetical protein Musp01_16280 [Muricauda sp. NBRC 101325]